MESKKPKKAAKKPAIWKITEMSFWKVAGEMAASREFIQTTLFFKTAQDSYRIKRQMGFMLECEMILEVTTPRGVTYIVNDLSPFWDLFEGKSPKECRSFWRTIRTGGTMPPDKTPSGDSAEPLREKSTKSPGAEPQSPAPKSSGRSVSVPMHGLPVVARVSEGESKDK